MLRREFIKTTASVLAASSLSSPAAFAENSEPRSRSVFPMNRNWRYHPTKVEGAHLPAFNDAAFQKIVIPHTNVKLPWHSFDDKDYQFVSTYRRRFQYPAAARGKRVFIDFEGAMTASTVWINGVSLGEYKGGFTPFSFELTSHLRTNAENVLVVQVDSTEREDIPPFGRDIDYMTFGGIYREVSLRIVPSTYIDNIFARPTDVLSGNPSLEVDCMLAGLAADGALTLEVELRDGEKTISKTTQPATMEAETDPDAAKDPATSAPVHASSETSTDAARHTVSLKNLGPIKLWELRQPALYNVHVRLLLDGKVIDQDTRRIGFREAKFTDRGFSLNGKIVKLHGLDRHQTFPFVGQAMPARVQRKDADILRTSLHCNIVRTSHYPQSRHFLDRCDEIGLLVLEEIPGWQHTGPEPWKQASIDNVGRMIRRDWNHPSVILWGVRINEASDDHDFYLRTNALAHALDPTRQTGGIRNNRRSELLEDVFTINDFGFPLSEPNHPLYLNTEFVGHTFPTKPPMMTSVSASIPCAMPASTISSPPIPATPEASDGAPSTTTPTPASAPATASAITASPTYSASQSRPPASTNRCAIRMRRSCSSRPSTGPQATNPSEYRESSSAPTAITSSSIHARAERNKVSGSWPPSSIPSAPNSIICLTRLSS